MDTIDFNSYQQNTSPTIVREDSEASKKFWSEYSYTQSPLKGEIGPFIQPCNNIDDLLPKNYQHN